MTMDEFYNYVKHKEKRDILELYYVTESKGTFLNKTCIVLDSHPENGSVLCMTVDNKKESIKISNLYIDRFDARTMCDVLNMSLESIDLQGIL